MSPVVPSCTPMVLPGISSALNTVFAGTVEQPAAISSIATAQSRLSMSLINFICFSSKLLFLLYSELYYFTARNARGFAIFYAEFLTIYSYLPVFSAHFVVYR